MTELPSSLIDSIKGLTWLEEGKRALVCMDDVLKIIRQHEAEQIEEEEIKWPETPTTRRKVRKGTTSTRPEFHAEDETCEISVISDTEEASWQAINRRLADTGMIGRNRTELADKIWESIKPYLKREIGNHERDLVLLVSRMARRLIKTGDAGNIKTAEGALDFLKRKDLCGSPFRTDRDDSQIEDGTWQPIETAPREVAVECRYPDGNVTIDIPAPKGITRYTHWREINSIEGGKSDA